MAASIDYYVSTHQGSRAYQEDKHAVALDSIPTFLVCDGHGNDYASDHASKNLPQLLQSQFANLPPSPSASSSSLTEGGEAGSATRDGEERKRVYHDIIRAAFLEEDMLLRKARGDAPSHRQSGTTSTVAIVDHERGMLAIGNVGDSRGVLARGVASGGKWVAERLTVDHKPALPAERKRLAEAGATVVQGRILDAAKTHSINMTKALGTWLLGAKLIRERRF